MKDDEKSTAIVPRQAVVDSLVPDAENLSKVAVTLLKAGMWTHLRTEAAVFAVIEYGRELGIPPVAALNTMAVVNGKLTMEAKAMLAVARQRAGVSWEVVESTAKGCKMIFERPGFKPLTVKFDEADAQAAGLLSKGGSWKSYPADMFFARCASRGVRQIAADAVLGLYSKEEMLDTLTPAPSEIVEAEVVEEEPKPEPEKKERKKPGPKPKAEEKPKEEPPQEEEQPPLPTPPEEATPPGPTVQMATDEIQQEIRDLINSLVDTYHRTPTKLIEVIALRLKQKFGTARKRIPQDLTQHEAIVIRDALLNTTKREQELAGKNPEEAL